MTEGTSAHIRTGRAPGYGRLGYNTTKSVCYPLVPNLLSFSVQDLNLGIFFLSYGIFKRLLAVFVQVFKRGNDDGPRRHGGLLVDHSRFWLAQTVDVYISTSLMPAVQALSLHILTEREESKKPLGCPTWT